MGITFVQKSDLNRSHRDCKVALVLAGGAVSGGAFKLGGLLALDSFLVARRVTEMDIYLGLSAGAFLAAPLAAGISPWEVARSLDGESDKIEPLRPWDFYWPNWRELAWRPVEFVLDALAFFPEASVTALRYLRRHARDVRAHLAALAREPSYRNLEALFDPIAQEIWEHAELKHAFAYLPSGLFDTGRIERFIRTNLEANGVPNNFRLLRLERGNALYIAATHLDTAQGVVFGYDEDNSVTISEAVQASAAIPGFYRPACINGEHYVDAGVRKTANISLAIRKGADLVIAYNPFRPYNFRARRTLVRGVSSIADMGLVAVLNQAFRTLLHTRLHLGIERLLLDPDFHGDVILIEPTERDEEFFDIHPLNFWRRREAMLEGFRSTRASLERHYPKLVRILRAYSMSPSLEGLRLGASRLGMRSDTASMAVSTRPRLRVVR